MRRIKLLIFFSLMVAPILVLSMPALAQGEGRVVTARGSFSSLTEALVQADEGEIIEVFGGIYPESLVIDKSVTLIGHDWPVIDGGGSGTVIKLVAPDITVRGFVIAGSGHSLQQENSGIAVEAPGAIIEDNRLEDTLFGVYLREADGGVIRNNVISSKDLDVPRRGDPIRVWFSNGVTIENNRISKGRDVVLWYSENLIVRNNQVADGRYGLHFMYCDDAVIENNLLTDNSVGTFMMYSRRLQLLNNTITGNRGPSGFGVGLKDMDDAVIVNNMFLDNRIGAHLDNSPRERDSIGRFEGNVFAYNDIGVNLMPSVRNNIFTGNSFVDNEQQVGIAGGSGGRYQQNDWTVDGRGNYWSDYVGYDANADGLGDVAYKSERLFENLMDRDSSLRLFIYSPVEQAVDFAARAVPFVKPQPKMVDEAPLMQPEVPAGLPLKEEGDKATMWIASLGLLLMAAAILVFGSINRFRPPNWKSWFRGKQNISGDQLPVSHNRG
ncbi:MAG: nitrous oxide reductase family maturation protein NosD [Candidatus Promineifilaceae bacterium]